MKWKRGTASEESEELKRETRNNSFLTREWKEEWKRKWRREGMGKWMQESRKVNEKRLLERLVRLEKVVGGLE